MNTETNHVAGPDFMQKLRDAGVDGGYEPVPKHLLGEARKLLGGKLEAYATRLNAEGLYSHMKRKRKLRNKRKALHRAGVPGY